MYYVYAILDPRKPGVFRYGKWLFDYEPFYIGKGKDDRAICHWRAFINHIDDPEYIHRAYNKLKDKRFQSIHKSKLEPIVVIKKRGMVEQTAFAYEIAMIETIGRVRYGGPLLNLSIGGAGGGNMLGKKHTAKSIAKNRESNQLYSASLSAEARSTHSRSGWSDRRKKVCREINSANAKSFWDGPSGKVEERNAKVKAYAINRYATMSDSELAKFRAKQKLGHIAKHLPERKKDKIKIEIKAYIDRSKVTDVSKLCRMVENRFNRMCALS